MTIRMPLIALLTCLVVGPAMAQTDAKDAAKPPQQSAQFAQQKKALISTRARTDICIAAALDRQALVQCMKLEHADIKAQREARLGKTH